MQENLEMNSICAVITGVTLCLLNKNPGFFSKVAVNFICIVLLLTNKDH